LALTSISLASLAQAPVAPVIVNPGFESTGAGNGGNPEGWWSLQHAGSPSYAITLDSAVRHTGEYSVLSTNIGPEPFGALVQSLPALPWRGRTLRLSAWLRTEGVTGNRFGKGATLTLQAMSGGYPVAHNHGKESPATGTAEWTRREVALLVPPLAEKIEIGMLHFGPGKVWVDDFAIEALPAGQ
jgi:hypothetical protein